MDAGYGDRRDHGRSDSTLGVEPRRSTARWRSMKKNDVSPVLTLPANRLAVVGVDRPDPRSAVPTSNEVEGQGSRSHSSTDKSRCGRRTKAKEAADRAARGRGHGQGGQVDEAGSDRLGRVRPHRFGGGPRPARPIVQDAFTKPVGTIVGPIHDHGPRSSCIKVVDQQKADPIAKLRRREASEPSRLSSCESRRRR